MLRDHKRNFRTLAADAWKTDRLPERRRPRPIHGLGIRYSGDNRCGMPSAEHDFGAEGLGQATVDRLFFVGQFDPKELIVRHPLKDRENFIEKKTEAVKRNPFHVIESQILNINLRFLRITLTCLSAIGVTKVQYCERVRCPSTELWAIFTVDLCVVKMENGLRSREKKAKRCEPPIRQARQQNQRRKDYDNVPCVSRWGDPYRLLYSPRF